MIRLLGAHLIGSLLGALLRPLLRLGVLVLGVAVMVELPVRLWQTYVGAGASEVTLDALRWAAGLVLAAGWLRWWVLPAVRGGRRQ